MPNMSNVRDVEKDRCFGKSIALAVQNVTTSITVGGLELLTI